MSIWPKFFFQPSKLKLYKNIPYASMENAQLLFDSITFPDETLLKSNKNMYIALLKKYGIENNVIKKTENRKKKHEKDAAAKKIQAFIRGARRKRVKKKGRFFIKSISPSPRNNAVPNSSYTRGRFFISPHSNRQEESYTRGRFSIRPQSNRKQSYTRGRFTVTNL